MQVSAHGKTGFRRQQQDIRRRTVRQEINDPSRQHQFMQIRIDRDESVRVLKARNLDAFGLEKSLGYGRLPGSHDKCSVDFASDQLFRSNLRRKRQQFADNAIDPGSFDYLQRQGTTAASL